MIKNGDVWDIGQSVSGNSRFLYLSDKWYYAVGYNKEMFKSELYDPVAISIIQSRIINISNPIYKNQAIKLIGNIFTDDMDFDFSQCDEVLQAIRDYRLDTLLNNSDKI